MRGIVVGLGSMGKRRIRLMRDFFADMELCGVDSSASRRAEAAGQFGIPCYASVGEGVAAFGPECGFVCTSPLTHAGIIRELLGAGLHVFTEINLVPDGYAENTALAAQKGLELFLSSTPLYRRETRFIEEQVQAAAGPLVYRYHVGQYLPDWHPWENYRSFFVADRRTGGCREIFGIELPWLTAAFGEVAEVAGVLGARQTALAIDYPDSWLVTLRHESGALGQLAVNVVSRKAVRELEVIGETLYLRWGGTPAGLSVYDYGRKREIPVNTYETVEHDARYADNIVENAYVDELAAFFAALKGESPRRHTFARDARLLALIDRIEAEGVR